MLDGLAVLPLDGVFEPVGQPSAGGDAGDVITGRVEVIEARTDKPVTKLRTTVTRGDGTVALDGTAVCYTMAITAERQ